MGGRAEERGRLPHSAVCPAGASSARRALRGALGPLSFGTDSRASGRSRARSEQSTGPTEAFAARSGCGPRIDRSSRDQLVDDRMEEARVGGPILAESRSRLEIRALCHHRRPAVERVSGLGRAAGSTRPAARGRGRTASRARAGGSPSRRRGRIPGSVSSAERRPPPTVSSASWTVTSQPARAIVIAAASPFGPEPITTARLTRAASAAPAPTPVRPGARARTGRRASRSAPGPPASRSHAAAPSRRAPPSAAASTPARPASAAPSRRRRSSFRARSDGGRPARRGASS